MRITTAMMTIWVLLALGSLAVHAQQPQIPTMQVCNPTQVKGKATVKIASRSDATHAGNVVIRIELKCDPKGTGYPDGALDLIVDMSDSIVEGTVTGVTFEQVTSSGKHSPTVYLNGRCKAEKAPGCRFWLMIADNKPANQRGTPDVISFLVFNGLGQRVAYGTGPVVDGDIVVSPSPF